MRRFLKALAVLFVIVVAALFLVGPAVVDRSLNRVEGDGSAASVSVRARQLHDLLFVADLHADPLLWDRDLLVDAGHGHVDIPRLIRGGVALQVFAAPTQVPAGINYEANELDYDVVTALSILQRWPVNTWQSPLQRAVHMADVLKQAAADSEGRFRVVRNRIELDRFTGEHATDPGIVAGLLAIEGLHALEGNLENVDVLFRAGFRMMGLTHFFDNQLGGSAHGMSKEGLSDFGRQVVARLQERHILVDVAHASPTMIDEVLAMATTPVIVSHGGVKGTCDNVRNLSDAHLRGVAATGGVVGIGYWDAAVCDVSVDGIVRAIRYAIDVAGVDHVGLGSDFDGATTTPFDTTGIPRITQGLMDSGLDAASIRKVMGDNVRRVLAAGLPQTAG